MSEDIDAIVKLADRLEAASEGSRELDAGVLAHDPQWEERYDGRLEVTRYWHKERGTWICAGQAPAYTTSLDAAMSLVPEGWTADVRRYPNGDGNAYLSEWSPPCRNSEAVNADTPALALCAAALRARLEQDQS